MNQMAAEIQAMMLSRGLTLSTAESCTSGRIAAAITTVSGASGYFQGGLVAYQDHIKVQQLGVSAEDIEQHDVVSREVVEQMVKGACRLFNTDCAMASTGYAGDGNDRIPAGTIWIGWGTAVDVHSMCLRLDSSRDENTKMAVEYVLRYFKEYLEKHFVMSIEN